MSKIKELLKKSDTLKKVYGNLNEKFTASLVKSSPVLASKYMYKRATGKKLNLDNPQDFNEKLQWLKLYWQHPLVAKCADKYELREHVEECGCGQILNELYGVYESTSEIEWQSLPNKFALKTTNSCGTNIIVDDKSKFIKEEVFNKLEEWLKVDYGLVAAEIHYSRMTPRIICEKYIETDAGLLPNDYKIYCFNGKAKIILIASEREEQVRLHFLDLEWNKIDIGSEQYNKGKVPQKPSCIKEMIEYSEKISKPFPFVRVDFYDNNGLPILGEMTFTPAGCAAMYYNQYGLDLLGSMLELPVPYIDNIN